MHEFHFIDEEAETQKDEEICLKGYNLNLALPSFAVDAHLETTPCYQSAHLRNYRLIIETLVLRLSICISEVLFRLPLCRKWHVIISDVGIPTFSTVWMMLFAGGVFNILSYIFLTNILATVFRILQLSSSQMSPFSMLHPASVPEMIPTKAENYQQPRHTNLWVA